MKDKLQKETNLSADADVRQAILDASVDCIKIIDLQGNLVSMNEPGMKLMEIDDFNTVAGACWTDFWKRQFNEKAVEALEKAKQGSVTRFQGWCETYMGTPKWWDVTVAPIFGGHGKPVQVLSISRDETDRKNIMEDMRVSQIAMNSSRSGIVVLDANIHGFPIIHVNPAFSDITLFGKEEIMGQEFSFLTGEKTDLGSVVRLRAALDVGKGHKETVFNYRKDGCGFWDELTITPVRDSEGVLTHFVCVHDDVSLDKNYRSELERLALHDALTGLPNRALLQERLSQACGVARREKGQVAVLFMDLDRFKLINDTLGHDAGDVLLKSVAEKLESCVSVGDTVARFGGDEFVVILNETKSRADVEVVVRKIFEKLEAPIRILKYAQDIFINASLGIALYPSDGKTESILTKYADTALYSAKEAGRKGFMYYADCKKTNAENSLTFECEMRVGLVKEEFEVYYQPIYSVKDNSLVSLEALIRWNHPAKGLLLPKVFLSYAEDSGLIHLLGSLSSPCAATSIDGKTRGSRLFL